MLQTACPMPIPERLPARISGSWARCLQHGLQREHKAILERGSSYDVRQLLQRGAELLRAAQAELRPLASALSGTGHLAFVVDDRGRVIAIEGDAAPAESLLHHVRCGIDLSESVSGTNAAGTALVARRATKVHREEHFLTQLAALDCYALPIISPHGRVLGALTVSSDRAPQTPGVSELTQIAVSRIERQLVCGLGSPLLLRVHPHVDGIGSAAEGLIAVGADGEVLGINACATRMLGAEASALIGGGIETLFDRDPLRTMSLTGQASLLRVPGGLGLSARLVRNTLAGKGRARNTAPVAPQAAPRIIETLSARELQVMRVLESGATNAEIAQGLHISDDAVKYHLKNVFAKLGASSRLEAVKLCREFGLIP